jgi:hypothetical protein
VGATGKREIIYSQVIYIDGPCLSSFVFSFFLPGFLILRKNVYAPMGETRKAYRILVGKPEGKRPLGRPRRRWVDTIKMDLRDTKWDGIDWIELAQDREQWRALVNTVMNLRVP